MSARRGTLLFAFIAVCCCLVIILWPKPPVLQFMSKSREYYREFAHACDTLLQKYPAGTNDFIRIASDDPGLPTIIRDLRYGVDRVTISSNCVHIVVPAPWHGFGIVWETQGGVGGETWELATYHESERRVAYAEKR